MMSAEEKRHIISKIYQLRNSYLDHDKIKIIRKNYFFKFSAKISNILSFRNTENF